MSQKHFVNVVLTFNRECFKRHIANIFPTFFPSRAHLTDACSVYVCYQSYGMETTVTMLNVVWVSSTLVFQWLQGRNLQPEAITFYRLWMLNQEHESKSNCCLILSRVKLKCNAFHRDAFLCTRFKYSEEKHSLVLQRENRYKIKM